MFWRLYHLGVSRDTDNDKYGDRTKRSRSVEEKDHRKNFVCFARSSPLGLGLYQNFSHFMRFLEEGFSINEKVTVLEGEADHKVPVTNRAAEKGGWGGKLPWEGPLKNVI